MPSTADIVHGEHGEKQQLSASLSQNAVYPEPDHIVLENRPSTDLERGDGSESHSLDEEDTFRPSWVQRSGYNGCVNGCILTTILLTFLAIGASIASSQTDLDLTVKAVRSHIPGFKGNVFYPGDTNFEKQIRVKFWPVWNRKPAMVLEPVDEDDVVLSLQFVRDTGKHFTILSGGNSYGGWGVNSGGICISMKNMTEISLDDQGVVTIGPGVTSGKAMERLVPEGWGMVFSNWPAVGLGGFVQGGGFGVNSRKHGLAIDSLLSARIVLADGSIQVVNQTHMSDLFWALRGGGGGNWGVVTQYKIQAHREIFVVGHVDVTIADLPPYLEWLAQHARGLADNFGMLVHCGYVNQTCQTWFQWIAPLDSPDQSVDVGIEYITEQFVGRIPVTPTAFEIFRDKIPNPASGGPETLFWSKNFFIKGYNAVEGVSTISTIFTKTYQEHPDFARLYLELWGGQISAKEPTESAFYWRDAAFLVGFEADVDSTLPDARLKFDATCTSIKENYYGKLSGLSQGGFVNYQDWTMDSKSSSLLYYGENLQQLKQIKRQYDPTNLFNFAQSIEP